MPTVNNLIPVTERSNPKSKDIDLLTALGISRVLTSCESEIFDGWEGSGGIFDEKIIKKCASFAEKIQNKISQGARPDVVLVGAGTSGRLCRLMAKVMAPVVGNKINLIPIIAGGIKALVRAEPNTEDRIQDGIDDFLTYTQNLDRSECFVIGVSCGLSANYVKGALDEANNYSQDKTAIIGFNPSDLATVTLGNAIQILNPIIGPEPIVGSVRMKGGTTTMILIYALLMAASQKKTTAKEAYFKQLRFCKDTLAKISDYEDEIARLITAGSKALRSGGRVYLTGSGGFGTLCIYDAAECPPTFGAKIDQVNGYSRQGIGELVYYPSEGKEKLAKEISFEVFAKEMLPGLSKRDLFLTISDTKNTLRHTNFYAIRLVPLREKAASVQGETIYLENAWQNYFQKLLLVRTLLGQLSTGSFVLAGKVYQNKMIDLRITNKKLFLRAIRIISEITEKEEAIVKRALLKSIYKGQPPSSDSLESHISMSAGKENVVPVAILSLIYPAKPVEELKLLLENEPVIRKLVIRELKNLR